VKLFFAFVFVSRNLLTYLYSILLKTWTHETFFVVL
jgi:hypothetical protein